MVNMDDSMAQAPAVAFSEPPAWKSYSGAIAAVLLALLFAVAGIWKLTDPLEASIRLMQAKAPGFLIQPFTLALGIGETFAAVLLVIPRLRRWGAWITALMLVAFMAHVGFYYEALRGQECSCFPWVKRAVGPGFFIGDAVMLALAALAALWSRPPEGVRTAGVILASTTVFALVSYGVALARQTGDPAPESITVAGEERNLKNGRAFLFFFDPECMHCYHAAQKMSKLNWLGNPVIGVPVTQKHFAAGFLTATGLQAGITNDFEKVKDQFGYTAYPYGVAVENGRQVARFTRWDDAEPYGELKKLGFTE
ncbi:MAG: hypothetical protein FJW40_04820 [Acidobacteria bacterium]|nr:hypothetical protein [Acidobacteriota bacterium]